MYSFHFFLLSWFIYFYFFFCKFFSNFKNNFPVFVWCLVLLFVKACNTEQLKRWGFSFTLHGPINQAYMHTCKCALYLNTHAKQADSYKYTRTDVHTRTRTWFSICIMCTLNGKSSTYYSLICKWTKANWIQFNFCGWANFDGIFCSFFFFLYASFGWIKFVIFGLQRNEWHHEESKHMYEYMLSSIAIYIIMADGKKS